MPEWFKKESFWTLARWKGTTGGRRWYRNQHQGAQHGGRDQSVSTENRTHADKERVGLDKITINAKCSTLRTRGNILVGHPLGWGRLSRDRLPATPYDVSLQPLPSPDVPRSTQDRSEEPLLKLVRDTKVGVCPSLQPVLQPP